MSEIPHPDDTGSAGTQKMATQQPPPSVPDSSVGEMPIAEAMVGLAATKSRSMGGETAATLIAGSFAQLSHDLQKTRQDLQETRQRLSDVQEELSEYKTKAAVLTERIRAHARGRHLKNLSITVGSTLVVIGIELYRNDLVKVSLPIGILGGLLVVFGWLSTGGEVEQ